MELNSYSHGYGQITYHIVFVPKYRHKIFYGPVMKRDCEQVIRRVCDRKGYRVISIHVADDHVHLFIEFHPTDTLSGVIKQLKGEICGSCCSVCNRNCGNDRGKATCGALVNSTVALAM